jgi:glycosyltransferase involved in cell wall biosynthesis
MTHPSRSKHVSVVAVVVLPPPVTGMTLATKAFIETMRDRVQIDVINLSKGANPHPPMWRFIRSVNVIRACISLFVWRGDSAQRKFVYQAANSGLGLLYNLLVVIIAHLRGWHIIFHHHVYRYMTTHDRIMALVDKFMDSKGIHIVLSEKMRCDFINTYKPRAAVIVVNNGYAVARPERPGAISNGGKRFRLGHISNLCYDKGLDLVLETYREIVTLHNDVDLMLAGPLQDEKSRELIEAYRGSGMPGLIYLGPVYGTDKTSFYRDIDLLLFPSRYRNEAQPLVILEAMAHGLPVVALDIGCIGKTIGRAGYTINDEGKWIRESTKWILQLMRFPGELHRLGRHAMSRFSALQKLSNEQIEDLVSHL